MIWKKPPPFYERTLQVVFYWSSTTYSVGPEFAWNVWYIHSHASNAPGKTNSIYIWPVCSTSTLPKTAAHELTGYNFTPWEDGKNPQGIDWPTPRFRDNRDGTMTDNMTGLMWIKNAGMSEIKNYAETLTFLNELNTGKIKGNCGYNDWHIPTLEEMRTLVHLGKADGSQWLKTIEPGFENVGTLYWTSTVFSTSKGRESVWFISMQAGVTAEFAGNSKLAFWPVRSSD